MAYAHYIHRPPVPFRAIVHSREVESPSGLLTGIVHLGYTALYGPPPERNRTSLHLPNMEEVFEYGNIESLDLGQYTSRVECATIEEFEEVGRRILKEEIELLEEVVRIKSVINEKSYSELHESSKARGHYGSDFYGYYADQAELEVLTRLGEVSTQKVPEPSGTYHGVYL